MKTVNGKTALVTGSTDGVGRFVAQKLAEDGWRVLVHGRDRSRGERVVAEVRSKGGAADLLPADATAATIASFSSTTLARTTSRTMAVPIRPVAPTSATLVTYAPYHVSAATVCRSARTHARLAP